jgi:hypothetical protein
MIVDVPFGVVTKFPCGAGVLLAPPPQPCIAYMGGKNASNNITANAKPPPCTKHWEPAALRRRCWTAH